METDKTVPLLQLLAALGRGKGTSPGLYVVTIKTAEPDPVTLVMEGTKLALDLAIFEIPVELYPLRKGDRFLAYPLVATGTSQRWGILTKVNGGVVMANMQSATSLQPDGMAVTYDASRLVIPPYFLVGNTTGTDGDLVGSNSRPLAAGDRVSIAPTLDGETIKYVILNKY
jgi:hypothetical protein